MGSFGPVLQKSNHPSQNMVQADAEQAAEKLAHIEKVFTAIQLNKNQPGHKLA